MQNDVIYEYVLFTIPAGRVAPPARQMLARDHRPVEVLGTRQEAAGWPSLA